ncbi:MAG: phosphatase PAP2 family protein [Rhodospirillaceae bacterium]|nr:phosphatase PAP2 family protein [Rhodospirillaceae bacterium]
MENNENRNINVGSAASVNGRGVIGSFVDSISGLGLSLTIMVGYIIAVEIILWATTGNFANTFSSYLYYYDTILKRIALILTIVIAASAIWMLWKNITGNGDVSTSLTKQLINGWRAHLAKPGPWMRLLVILIFYQPFFSAFATLKEHIPKLNPFSHWDVSFAELDRVLHFTMDPWQITWALFSSPWATVVIDRLYISWYSAVYGTLFAVILFDNNTQRRARFILAHILLWVLLGSISAVAFSSVGPCFYNDAIGTQQSFGELMARLGAVDQQYPLYAIKLQAMLWDGYIGARPIFEGISAMPSLHIAQAALLALYGATISKKLALILWVYFLIMLIGSVHLGWHYAVDGYFAAIGTLLIWWLSGIMSKVTGVPFRSSKR